MTNKIKKFFDKPLNTIIIIIIMDICLTIPILLFTIIIEMSGTPNDKLVFGMGIFVGFSLLTIAHSFYIIKYLKQRCD